MGTNYKLIIWDVDGTLLDTSEGIIAASKYAIEESGFVVPSNDVLKTFIGPPIQQSFARILGIAEGKAMEMADVFRQHYKDYDLLKAEPYEGLLTLVSDIYSSGVKQGVATYKRQDYAERIVKSFGFAEYMDVIYGSDFEGKLAKKDIIENVIKDSGITERDKIVMIGDTDNDIRGASQLGIDFIAVTYGFGFSTGNIDVDVKAAADADELRHLLEV